MSRLQGILTLLAGIAAIGIYKSSAAPTPPAGSEADLTAALDEA